MLDDGTRANADSEASRETEQGLRGGENCSKLSRVSIPKSEELLAIAARAARQGGALVQEGFRKSKVTHKKGATDLVTDYDRACEKLLREILERETPYPVMGEELGGASDREPVRWLVDPIDGTTNYVHGHPFFCVSIGLVKEGAPLLGAIFAPALGLEWTGIVGAGATRSSEPARVSKTTALEDALLATGFPYDRSEAHPDFVLFERMKGACQAVRRCGAAALDLALVADGTYDGYWERRLHPWDIAAGAAIVLAAGGCLSRYDGSPFDVRKADVIASNGPVHSALAAQVKTLGEVS